MSIVFAIVAAAVFGCGVYMVLSRHALRMVLGLSLLTTAVNLIIFQAGRIRSNQPPIIAEGTEQLGQSADPLPQALVLTAIVIGFALTIICAALVLRAWRAHGSMRMDEINSAQNVGNLFPPEQHNDH